jgi:glycosyltransferase involved in cell wall biosynthesis
MRISVVIATYNRAALLRSALQALGEQDYASDDEVIIIDNGSSDDTPQVIARAAAEFPVPLRYVRETIPGKTAALVTGIGAASGDVLALTDDDVLADGDWIARIREIFRGGSIALVGGRVDPLWEHETPWWLNVEMDGDRYGSMCSPLALLHYGEAQELGARTAVGANLAITRSAFAALGGLRADLGRHRGTLLCGEDHDLCQRAVAAGFRCEYRPELRVRHLVPAARTRLGYFIRWFFWSGVTQALLEMPEGAASRGPSLNGYYARQLVTSSLRAAGGLVTGRPRAAVEHLMNAAFAAGYLGGRLRMRARTTSKSAVSEVEGNTAREQAGVHG